MDKRQTLANARAEEYAPRPKGGSLMAGVSGGLLALLIMIAVTEFYDWNLLGYVWIAALLVAAGFLAGFLGYKRLARLSRNARRDERARIDRDEDALQRKSRS